MIKNMQQLIWTASNGGVIRATFIENGSGKVDSISLDTVNVLIDPDDLKESLKFFDYVNRYVNIINLASNLNIDFSQAEVRTGDDDDYLKTLFNN